MTNELILLSGPSCKACTIWKKKLTDAGFPPKVYHLWPNQSDELIELKERYPVLKPIKSVPVLIWISGVRAKPFVWSADSHIDGIIKVLKNRINSGG